MNPMKLMKQAQKMQADMQKMQAELASKTYEAEAGGGAVKAIVNGEGDLKDLTISPDIVAEGDAEMIQDLVLTAVREALATSRKDAQSQMSKISANMPNIPGLGF
ncbi:MAG: YbaB/EbfC family nucleoid-associated protein [Verrucomicrobiota bacterium]